MRARFLVVLATVFAVGGAGSSALAQQRAMGRIDVHDAPGTNGTWQEGSAIISAPPAAIERWMTDYAGWRAIYPDIEFVQVLGTSPDGTATVRFKSSILGRTLTLRLRAKPGLIDWSGAGSNVSTRGRTYIIGLPDGRSRVVMQNTAQIHGFIGWIAPEETKKKKADAKIRSDLMALERLASQRPQRGAATPPPY